MVGAEQGVIAPTNTLHGHATLLLGPSGSSRASGIAL